MSRPKVKENSLSITLIDRHGKEAAIGDPIEVIVPEMKFTQTIYLDKGYSDSESVVMFSRKVNAILWMRPSSGLMLKNIKVVEIYPSEDDIDPSEDISNITDGKSIPFRYQAWEWRSLA